MTAIERRLVGLCLVCMAAIAASTLTEPSTTSTNGTASCDVTAGASGNAEINCGAGAKAVHVRNNNAVTVCFGENSGVTTTNAAACRSTALGEEHARNAQKLFCVAASGTQTIAYECLR